VSKPLIKVCGMKYLNNVESIAALKPDFMGFIFYEKSKRKVAVEELDLLLAALPSSIKKVGVFVNASYHKILKFKNKFDLIQLHGDETPKYCKQIKDERCSIIKAFGVNEEFDFNNIKKYLPYCNYFLFDTKTFDYGGSGKKYNWQKLSEYQFNKPFFLSGGISLDDIDLINEIQHPQLFAVDINSKFEIKPGVKYVEQVQSFIKKIRL